MNDNDLNLKKKKQVQDLNRVARTLAFIEAYWKTVPYMSLGEVITKLAGPTGVAQITDDVIVKEIGTKLDIESSCEY